ncbi:unnamed protein product [Effrenium voratum]|uniref:Uncharacterized protein n=1 Tax=Effrenium voratum TaxID=2562239 RepID=A0AA36IXE0_9DINO|nr:unnamed protein product [Effrenium voratum]
MGGNASCCKDGELPDPSDQICVNVEGPGDCLAGAGQDVEILDPEASPAEGLRRTKSLLHLEVDEEILRGISLSKTLRGLGKLWRHSPSELPTKQRETLWRNSNKVVSLHLFVSHTWRTSGRWKVLALLLRTSWTHVILSWALCVAATTCLYAWEVLPRPMTAVNDVEILGTAVHVRVGPWLMVAHLPSILLGFAVAPYLARFRSDQCFLDVACIHQTDEKLMERGVYGLGGFLARSKTLLILWSKPYFSRLWCVFEIAAYRAANPEGHLQLAPLFVELTALLLWAVAFCAAVLSFAVSFVQSPMNQLAWLAIPFALVPQLLATHFLRRLISQKHRLTEELANFYVAKAECQLDFDRQFIMTAIDAWYGSEKAFNTYVQGPLREELLSMRSDQIPSVYFLLFYSIVMTPSLEVFIGMCLDGYPLDVLWARVLAQHIGFSFASQMVSFKVLIYLCDRFATARFGGSCPVLEGLIDFLQSVVIFVGYLIVDLGSYVCCARAQQALWSSALYGLSMLCLAAFFHGCCRRRCW